MKKRNYYLLIVIVLCFSLIFITTPVNAFLKSEAKKAQEMIQKALELKEIGLTKESTAKFQEAETTLTQALTKNTGDIDALYALGTLNYYRGQRPTAEKRFQIVYVRNPSYGLKIRDFYLEQSRKAQQINRLDQSIALAVKAYDYEPAEKKKIAEKFFQTGSNFLFEGNLQYAMFYYNASVQLNPDYRQPNTMALITACKQQTNHKQRLRLLHAALKFSNETQSPAIIQAAETIGHQLKKQNIKQALVTNELDQLPKEVNVIIIGIAYPPDYKVYYPREKPYVFKLAKGEETEKFIFIPDGIRTNIEFLSNNHKYQVRYKDGPTINAYKGVKLPITRNGYFKIRAIEDTIVGIKIKKL